MLPSFSLLLPAFGLLVNKNKKLKSFWHPLKFEYLFSCSRYKGGTEDWARGTWSSRLNKNHSRIEIYCKQKKSVSNDFLIHQKFPRNCSTKIDVNQMVANQKLIPCFVCCHEYAKKYTYWFYWVLFPQLASTSLILWDWLTLGSPHRWWTLTAKSEVSWNWRRAPPSTSLAGILVFANELYYTPQTFRVVKPGDGKDEVKLSW